MFTDIKLIKKAYSHSQRALLANTFTNGEQHGAVAAVYSDNLKSYENFPITPEQETKLVNSTLICNFESVSDTFQSIVSYGNAITIGQQRKRLLQLYDMLCVFLANKEIAAEEFFNEIDAHFDDIIFNSYNLIPLSNLLLSSYQKFIYLSGEDKNDLLATIIRFIDNNAGKNISLQQLADEMNLSYAYMGRYFKNKMHISFVDYVQSTKVKMAQELLLKTDLNLIDIAEKTGFNTPNTFFRTFKNITGVTPNEFRVNEK